MLSECPRRSLFATGATTTETPRFTIVPWPTLYQCRGSNCHLDFVCRERGGAGDRRPRAWTRPRKLGLQRSPAAPIKDRQGLKGLRVFLGIPRGVVNAKPQLGAFCTATAGRTLPIGPAQPAKSLTVLPSHSVAHCAHEASVSQMPRPSETSSTLLC